MDSGQWTAVEWTDDSGQTTVDWGGERGIVDSGQQTGGAQRATVGDRAPSAAVTGRPETLADRLVDHRALHGMEDRGCANVRMRM